MGLAIDATYGVVTVDVERARSDHVGRPAVVRDALDDESDLAMTPHRAVRAFTRSRRFVDADLGVGAEPGIAASSRPSTPAA